MTDSSASIAAIYLTNETSCTAVQLLGSVILPPLGEKASKLRDVIRATFQTEFGGNHEHGFLFISHHGWEVSQSLEREVNISKLLFDDQSIRIRAIFSKLRVGVLLCPTDAPVEAIGFVFVEKLTCSVADFRIEFQQQHAELYKTLSDPQLALLDSNGWPLTSSQESHMLLLHVLANSCVRARKLSSFEAIDLYDPNVSHSRPHSFIHQQSRGSVSLGGRNPSLSHSVSRPGPSDQECFQIMISYIHNEATKEAVILRDEFRKLNFSVFLDIDCIKPGLDWQDTLNDAVYKTSLFVPLITTQYGMTEWTNREVKLADILNKTILPVSFLSDWPPMCLAIQFATTQYVHWTSRKESDLKDVGRKVAQRISEFYQKMTEIQQSGVEEEDGEDKRGIEAQPSRPSKDKKLSLLCKQNSLSSFGSLLPKCIPKELRDSIMKPCSGKPLIIISCHPAQLEAASDIEWMLQKNGYEAWITSIKTDPTKTRFIQVVKAKMTDAAAVIFIISKEYCDCNSCEKEVFYFEGRKRLLPVLTDTIKLPDWMATLIGFEVFLDSRSETFQETLLAQLQIIVNPEKAEVHMRKIEQQKAELVKMAVDLEKTLPSEGRMVYISGGTFFFSENGEAICREVGKHLAREEDIVLVTGGFFGVGETVGRNFYAERKRLDLPENIVHIQAKRDDGDRSMQTRQNSDRTFQSLPYGKTYFFCDSIHQREMLTPRVVPLCILIEGGPGASFEAQQFVWNDHTIIPVKVTGGAAGGMFNGPPGMFDCPPDVKETDWKVLQDTRATPTAIAIAINNIINSLQPRKSS